MTAKQITDKIALLKQAMKDAKVKGVKDKIKSKIEDLRQQAKTSNISTTQLAKSLLGSQRKVSNMTDAELRSAIKQLKPRSEYSFLKTADYKSLGVVKDDLKRFAKPVGWRIKGKNNVHKPSPKELAIAKRKGTAYYEDRPNRADVVRPVKLEDGGIMARGGSVNDVKITFADDLDFKKDNKKFLKDIIYIEVERDTYTLANSLISQIRTFHISQIRTIHLANKKVYSLNSWKMAYGSSFALPFGGVDATEKISAIREQREEEEMLADESYKYYITIDKTADPKAIANFFYLLGKHSN